MHHHRAADHCSITLKLNESVNNFTFGHPVCTSFNVAEISDVPLFISRCTMQLTERVVMWAGTHASIAEVCLLVHVKAVQPRGKALDFVADLAGVRVRLLKPDRSVTACGGLWAAPAGLPLRTHCADGFDQIGHCQGEGLRCWKTGSMKAQLQF